MNQTHVCAILQVTAFAPKQCEAVEVDGVPFDISAEQIGERNLSPDSRVQCEWI